MVTNLLKRRESLAMYPRTTVLSVQIYSTTLVISSSSRSWELTLKETKAAVSSKRGTVTGFSGLTLVLSIAKVQCTCCLSSIRRRYEHWPYPIVLASEKWCSSATTTSPKFSGFRHLLISKEPSFSRSSLQHLHLGCKFSGRGLSQSVRFLHISCKICFPTRTKRRNESKWVVYGT